MAAEIPGSWSNRFSRAVTTIITGERPRLILPVRDEAEMLRRAREALALIEKTITENPGTGQARRLVCFLAGLYDGRDYPFDLTELRALHPELGNACIDYLNYDRLGRREVHRHLANGARALFAWIERYGLEPLQR